MKPNIIWNSHEGRWEVWIGGKLVSTHSAYSDAVALHRPNEQIGPQPT